MMPLANKTITCSISNLGASFSFYAYIDATGMPFTRAISSLRGDTGYVAGYKAKTSGSPIYGATATWDLITGLAGSGAGNLSGSDAGVTCTATWPLT